MKNSKIMILAILSIIAVISIVHGIMAPAHPRGRPAAAANTAATQPLPTQAPSMQAQSGQVPQDTGSVDRRAKRSQFSAWKRSPFMSANASKTSPVSGLVLSGIVWDKDNPKAVIGDAILTKGSTIKGNKVVDIKRDAVIITDGTNTFELKLAK